MLLLLLRVVWKGRGSGFVWTDVWSGLVWYWGRGDDDDGCQPALGEVTSPVLFCPVQTVRSVQFNFLWGGAHQQHPRPVQFCSVLFRSVLTCFLLAPEDGWMGQRRPPQKNQNMNLLTSNSPARLLLSPHSSLSAAASENQLQSINHGQRQRQRGRPAPSECTKTLPRGSVCGDSFFSFSAFFFCPFSFFFWKEESKRSKKQHLAVPHHFLEK